jgi:holliday junction DNA helicase RuvA
MIGYIKGRIIGKDESHILVETNGIGYLVSTVPAVLEKEIGSEAEVFTYLQVREDALNLFGFLTKAELSFFELLISVSGVGPKMALTILSSGENDLIKQAIVSEDIAVFTKIGGVGRKTAERIVVELKEKLGALTHSEGMHATGSEDLLLALENLGYSRKEIKDVLVKLDHSLNSEEKLRQALKLLSN